MLFYSLHTADGTADGAGEGSRRGVWHHERIIKKKGRSKLDFSNTIHEALEISVEQFQKDEVILTMPVGPKTRQPMGLLHGGASVVLAESAASMGTLLNINQEKEVPVGIEINANHLRAKKDGIVKAIATPIHKGRTTMVWDIKIVDENNELISICRCTIAILKKK